MDHDEALHDLGLRVERESSVSVSEWVSVRCERWDARVYWRLDR